MKKIKLILFIALLLHSFISFSQVTVYESFSDYKNDSGQKFDKIYWYTNSEIILLKDGIKSKIKYKSLWGFKYKEALFRIDKDNKVNLPIIVVAIGKLIYYENGMAHLRMLYSSSSSSYYSARDGYGAYVSKDLNSFVSPLAKGTNLVDKIKAKKGIKRFKKENPQFSDLFDCLKNYRIETVRRCIAKFEGYKDFN